MLWSVNVIWYVIVVSRVAQSAAMIRHEDDVFDRIPVLPKLTSTFPWTPKRHPTRALSATEGTTRTGCNMILSCHSSRP